VLWKSSKTGAPDWGDEKWVVTASFPELVNKDLTKFAAAMAQVSTTVVLLIGEGLLTQERGLKLIADVAQRFGQEINAVDELAKAQAEFQKRQKDKAAADSFNLPADLRNALAGGTGKPAPAPAPPAE
jgi:hypothetical protein